MRHILILGGTTEARRLAAELAADPALRVTSSLAGRVAEPRLPAGEVRVGGFGGAAGLADWLRSQHVHTLIDATHPFAQAISRNAAEAAAAVHIPLLALRRPSWVPVPGDRWHPVGSLAEAAEVLPTLGRRALLTTGRLGLAAFAGSPACTSWPARWSTPIHRCRPTCWCCSTVGRSSSTASGRSSGSTGSTSW